MRGRVLPLLAGLLFLLSGCIALPGQEPFGERTYEDDRAQRIYGELQEEIGQLSFADLGGYSIELTQGTVDHEIYETQEYRVAWHEGKGKQYLWYQDRLYCYDGETLAYRDMAWEELGAEDYAAGHWELALRLLGQEAEELTYKYIPLAAVCPYLLTAEYPETEWEGIRRRFPKLSIGRDGDKAFHTMTLRWQEKGSRSIGVSFFAWEGSTSLLAERRVWSFAYDLGLLDQGVPAASAQSDDREGSRAVIEGIDFDGALERAEYREDLAFPVPPEQGEE